MRMIPLLALALAWPAAALAQSVTVERGDVYYRAPGQSMPRRVTSSGHDRDPSLSPDGRMITFIRGTPADSVETSLGPDEATAVWVVGTDGSGARMLVRGRAAREPERALALMSSPQFSPDGKQVYFLSVAWVTSGAVHAVDVASGEERFVLPGLSVEVVPRGHYAGHLLVTQHRYFIVGGSFDWVWLFTADGGEVGPIGEGEAAVATFREDFEDDGS
jgi:dipeptidyl aminopeptidase/acylaminoacyl peptidase